MEEETALNEEFAIWDGRRLAEMVGGDEEFIVEILTLFLETSGADVQALHRAANAGDRTSVSRLAHTLKGASGNVGADAMMDIARQVEEALQREDDTQVKVLAEEVVSVFAATTEHIRRRLTA